MDVERRRALEEKRTRLQSRLRIEERKRGLRRTLDFLDAHGIPYELTWWDPDGDDQGVDPVHWILEHFPSGSDSVLQIDWSVAEGAVRGPEPEASAEELAGWFEELRAGGRIGDCRVTLLTDNGHDPMIHLSFGDIRPVPQLFKLEPPAWWVVCREGGWVLQYRWTEPWWWGPAASPDR
jgi:hypothetical protein